MILPNVLIAALGQRIDLILIPCGFHVLPVQINIIIIIVVAVFQKCIQFEEVDFLFLRVHCAPDDTSGTRVAKLTHATLAVLTGKPFFIIVISCGITVALALHSGREAPVLLHQIVVFWVAHLRDEGGAFAGYVY